MKMISSTSSTSISGVTFMLALWPPLGPTAILIIDLLYRYCCIPVARPLLPACRRSGSRWWRCKVSGLLLIGQKAELIHAGGANIVDHLHHPAELRSHVGFQKHAFIGPVRQLILDLLS